jgi:hypothetical protein
MKYFMLVFAIAMLIFNIAFVFYKTKEIPEVVLEKVQQKVEEELPEIPEIVPEFIVVPVYRDDDEESVHSDVLVHTKSEIFGTKHGRSTSAHENTHQINSELRNFYTPELKRRVNAFYVLNGNAALVDEPDVKMSFVKQFVPESLRSFRWKTHFTNDDWEDRPLYIMDEWSAYIIGAKCSVDDFKANRQSTKIVSGCLDFSLYTVALCIAIKEGDPEYWKNNIQFKSFVIWQLKEAKKTYLEGKNLGFDVREDEKLLNALLTSEDASDIKSFLRDELEGTWLND